MIYVFEAGSIVYDESVLSKEDKERAVGVEALPVQETPVGKTAVIKADKKTNKVWWEYIFIQSISLNGRRLLKILLIHLK